MRAGPRVRASTASRWIRAEPLGSPTRPRMMGACHDQRILRFSSRPAVPDQPARQVVVGPARVCIAAFFVFYLMVGMGPRGGETTLDNWLLTGPILVAAVSALGAGVTGLLAVLRSHEPGLLIALPILIGLLVTGLLRRRVHQPALST